MPSPPCSVTGVLRLLLAALALGFWVAAERFGEAFAAGGRAPAGRAPPHARVALLIVGHADRWVADSEAAMLQHAVLPLLRDGGVDVHVCSDVALAPAVHARLAAWPARVSIHALGESERFRRWTDCADALADASRAGALPGRARDSTYEWFVVTRPDLVLLGPLSVTHRDPRALHTRLRMAAQLGEGAPPLTTDHFSWLFSDDRCVDGCAAPCGHAFSGTEEVLLFDDMLSIFSHRLSGAFFSTYALELRQDVMDACRSGLYLHPFWAWVAAMGETRFTCAMFAQGVAWQPLALRAQLSSLSATGVRGALPFIGVPPVNAIAKNCSRVRG